MSQKDTVLKNYLSIPEVFADLFNAYIFNGEEVLKPQDLETLDSAETVLIEKKDKSVEAVQKYRDVVKKSAFGAEFIIFGVENQANIHYAMAIRSMLYDAISYTNQISEISKIHRINKDLSGDEYLSKFSKSDKLIPVITLVVYYGNDDWDGSADLYNMLEFPKENLEILKKFISNYKMNLLSINNINNIELYKTGLRELFGVIRNEKNGKSLKEYVEKNKNRFSNLDEATYNAIKVFINLDKYNIKEENLKNKKGGIDMSQALEDIKKEGIKEGKIEDAKKMLELKIDIEIIKKITGLTEKEINGLFIK